MRLGLPVDISSDLSRTLGATGRSLEQVLLAGEAQGGGARVRAWMLGLVPCLPACLPPRCLLELKPSRLNPSPHHPPHLSVNKLGSSLEKRNVQRLYHRTKAYM